MCGIVPCCAQVLSTGHVCRLLQKHFLRRAAELAAHGKERRRAVSLAMRFLQARDADTLPSLTFQLNSGLTLQFVSCFCTAVFAKLSCCFCQANLQISHSIHVSGLPSANQVDLGARATRCVAVAQHCC